MSLSLRRVASVRRPSYFRRLKTFVPFALGAFVLMLMAGCGGGDAPPGAYAPRPRGTVTFNRDIGPLLHEHCGVCHHAGGSAPFDLVTYDDARKRARQIADVTTRRAMPPWLPNPKMVSFVGERQLTAEQIGLIGQWVADGTPEGEPGQAPKPPEWKDGWALGEPDLVLKPVRPYTLAAEGRDVYRNLVIPIPLAARRYVKGLEFRPNSRAVHHAFFRFDRAGRARDLDGRDGQPGFGGVHAPRTAEGPITFASWQPGKTPRFYAADLAWPIEPGTDLVLQMHLQPLGKEETVAPEVALYFTDRPGTAIAFKIPLDSYRLEIPPGVTNHVVQDSFVLPIDVEVRGVLPHAHNLCRTLRGYADLPDGSRRWLMWIDEWDFNWQGDYQFVSPVALPKGTRLAMEYTFDNSTNNVRNPHQPPRTVFYGSETTDEMAELWLQVVMKRREDLETLHRALQPQFMEDAILANEALLRKNPDDSRALSELGATLVIMGRTQEGLTRLQRSLALNPDYDEAHYYAGLALRMQKLPALAQREFEAALRINPKHGKASGNLGLVLLEQGNVPAAAAQLEKTLADHPDDEIARSVLQQIRQQFQLK